MKLALFLGISCCLSASAAFAANERALKSLRHWQALAARRNIPYYGTPLLPGANRRRALGEAPLRVSVAVARDRAAFREEVKGQRAAAALSR